MRRSTFVVSVAILGVVLFAWGAWNAGADVTSADKLEGTWLFTITPAPGPVPPFQGLITFDEAGIADETIAALHANSAPLLPPGLMFNASDGYGAWNRQRGSHDTFEFVFLHLLFDPNGFHVGFLKVRGTQVVDGDTLAGEFLGEFIIGPPGLPDPDAGMVVLSLPGTHVGRRISVE